MKIFTMILFIASVSQAIAQDYTIEEIQIKPDDFVFDFIPITYPQFRLVNTKIVNSINDYIKQKTIDDQLSIFDTTISNTYDGIKFLMEKRGLKGFSYEKVFENKQLISIETDLNIIDRVDWHLKNHFNIDVKYGKVLTIDDIVREGKRILLDTIILKRKIAWLNNSYKIIQDSLIKEKEIEFREIYSRGLDEIENCIKGNIELIDFQIKKNNIVFYDNCELSTSVLNVCPFSTEIELNQELELKGIIKDEYFKLIFNK